MREQEDSSERAEEELLSTAKVVSGLEKKLKEAQTITQQKEVQIINRPIKHSTQDQVIHTHLVLPTSFLQGLKMDTLWVTRE